jgi:hypothetical protein
MINTLNEKGGEPGYFPVTAKIMVTSNENIRNVICETGLRRFIKSYRAGAFITTNLIVLY